MTAGNLMNRYIGTTEEPLCEAGRAGLLCRAYPDADFIFLSPMQRCIQTAELIYPGKTGQTVPDFRECDFGLFENKNYLELADCPEYQEWIDSGGTLPFPGGESPEGFKVRSCAAFEQVIRQILEQGWKNVSMVVHGGTIMSIMEHYALPHQEYYQWHVKNGSGYSFLLKQEEWSQGHFTVYEPL